MLLVVEEIRKHLETNKTLVISGVIRQEDYEMFVSKLGEEDVHFYTLAPSLEIARSDRGRGMNDWEYDRIKYHYETGIAKPSFGVIIDTTRMSLQEAAKEIINQIRTPN